MDWNKDQFSCFKIVYCISSLMLAVFHERGSFLKRESCLDIQNLDRIVFV
jgi:hypothetical protein